MDLLGYQGKQLFKKARGPSAGRAARRNGLRDRGADPGRAGLARHGGKDRVDVGGLELHLPVSEAQGPDARCQVRLITHAVARLLRRPARSSNA